ncbi:MAG: ATP-dependent DNA helicase RecG [Pseudomonadota bacterium]
MNKVAEISDLAEISVTHLRGVGPNVAEKLNRLNIATVQDLLLHLPHRYEDRTSVVALGALADRQKAVIEAEVELAEIAYRGRRNLLVRVSDGTGFLTLRFFYFSKSQQKQFAQGARVRCFGEVRRGSGGLEMVHPEYRVLRPTQNPSTDDTLTPVYFTTEGVQQGRIRNLVSHALGFLRRHPLKEWVPSPVLQELKLPTLGDAIVFLHTPPPDADMDLLTEGTHPAQKRLAFEELLSHHLSLRAVRNEIRMERGFALGFSGGLQEKLLDALSFKLTGAQQRVLKEIERDLNQPSPMLRLVQGDVGSGKTVVAALAGLCVIEAGFQVSLMAPTELLAEQHFKSLSEWMVPLGVDVTLLKGSLNAAQRRQVLHDMETGQTRFVVGTHALFQESVTFNKLGLVIVDEQHRFGVHQRLSLWEKGAANQVYPHQLVMTATPIPRTLAMTAYADLDCSVIDELPPGRTPIQTVVVSDARRAEVVERVKVACRGGHQVYWVCPLIEESENFDFEAAEDTKAFLDQALPDFDVGLVHGRMKGREKDAVMAKFAAGDFHVLVATTVIEVGVDVPNATLMIIENSERMGLAQLHQLRGRVGRGAKKSVCVLLHKSPMSRLAKIRLSVIRGTTDGFEIARQDLKLRGAGEVLGTRQTGLVSMKIADLVRDADLLPQIHSAAELIEDKYQNHIPQLINRWVSGADRYANV